MPNNSSQKLIARIKLVTPFLADKRSHGGIRKFETKIKDDETMLLLRIPQWRWALKEAMDSSGILASTDVDYVRFPTYIKCPTIRLYKRIWDSANPNKTETFECFTGGTEISIPIFLLHELEESISSQIQIPSVAPTKEQLEECLSEIGLCIGISPWGSKFGYGRFDLLSLDEPDKL